MPNQDISQVKLSSKVTVAKYIEFERARDREEISEFVYDRFYERYMVPILALDSDEKHGFSIMANCCLMVEAIESFYRGWPNTNGKSASAFCDFFDRANEFSDIKGYSSKFYKNVRCGILHQGETTGGWLITRKESSPLIDPDSLTINATKFLTALKAHLEGYQAELSKSDWDSEIWKNLRKKMDAIIGNCRRT